jgi:hypothetical protein
MLAFVKPWASMSATSPSRYLQYGRVDTLVPEAHGAWLAAHIRPTKVVVLEAGHLGDDSLMESDMAWLAGEVEQKQP